MRAHAFPIGSARSARAFRDPARPTALGRGEGSPFEPPHFDPSPRPTAAPPCRRIAASSNPREHGSRKKCLHWMRRGDRLRWDEKANVLADPRGRKSAYLGRVEPVLPEGLVILRPLNAALAPLLRHYDVAPLTKPQALWKNGLHPACATNLARLLRTWLSDPDRQMRARGAWNRCRRSRTAGRWP